MKRKISKQLLALSGAILVATLWVPVIDGGEKLGWIPVIVAYPFLISSPLYKDFDIFMVSFVVVSGHIASSAFIAWIILKIRNIVKTKLEEGAR
jgi:hypothetical protein